VRRDDRAAHLLVQLARTHGQATASGLAADAAGRDLHGGVAWLALHGLAHLVDEAHDRRVGVRDRGLDIGAHALAGDVAQGAREEVAAAAAGKRLVHAGVEVGGDPCLACPQRPGPVVALDDQRLAQRLQDLALQAGAGLVGGQTAERDAADADALGDRALVRLVVRVDPCGEAQEHEEDEADEQEGPGAHRPGVGRTEP
jgi:hypothetical protein